MSRANSESVRRWDGIEDDSTDVLTERNSLNVVENMNYFVKGELGRRQGLGGRITNTGIVCGELNGLVIFIKSNGNIESEVQ